MKRKVVFKLIAIALPFIFIFILEVLLRMVGYGEDYQLFHRIPMDNKPDYLVMNKKMAKKYFQDDDLRSDNQSDLFLQTKTDSTFRVFVQGASTVVGFPFYKGGSFPRMLKHRLSLTFPDKNVEVINTGMTAVNSYTLLDIANDIIKQNPDLVIIYAGHNEYYGAYGIGSSISYGSFPFVIRSYLKLKKLRFFQLLENTYHKISSSSFQKPSERTTTLMEVMAKEQRIPLDSKVYQDGLDQFQSNLDKLLSKYNNYEIPVILSTVVSNEKDIQPFISEGLPNETEFRNNVDYQDNIIKKTASSNAKAAYILGRSYLQENKDSAQKYLHLAKELDLLRFRAPEKINEIIQKKASKYKFPLVDMETVFIKHSPSNIVGNELMTEHVHPNIKGQFLMADAFYEKIKELDLFNDWSNYISFNEAIRDIPVSRIDSIQGIIVIDKLKISWPYNLNSNQEIDSVFDNNTKGKYRELKLAQDINQNIIKWDDAMAMAYNMYNSDGKYEKALQVAQTLIFEYPEQGKVYEMAGTMCLKMMDYKKAAFYFSKLNSIEPSALSANQLALAFVGLNKNGLAKKTLKNAQNKGFEVKDFDKVIEEFKSMELFKD
ncbi:SGNH/GDSL hydrolase family protein [Aegicerativicinus sediminis]|uniref:SGNH/GDSL hydrolase family protein n=1 Tax=Aegicerativicinus sediminis TaxID=2893202 RepID=UPI001E4BD7AD|nr:hypothetical protein [Aegicerativicinus sediminis]